MKKISLKILFVLFLVAPLSLCGQKLVSFETLDVPEVGYYNGSTSASGELNITQEFSYTENGVTFDVFFTAFGTNESDYYWRGMAYSNGTDTVTADMTNYSAYTTTGGFDSSANYGIGYIYIQDFITFESVVNLQGVYIANSTWTYHYIKGTGSSKSTPYQDGDYYKIIFKGIDEADEYVGETEFNLADFQDGKSLIVDDWTYWDLSELKGCKKIEFSCESSDNFTPYYFCIDNLSFGQTDGIDEKNTGKIAFYPNPTSDFITISQNFDLAEIYDMSGKKMIATNNSTIDVTRLSNGVYVLKINDNNKIMTSIFVKK